MEFVSVPLGSPKKPIENVSKIAHGVKSKLTVTSFYFPLGTCSPGIIAVIYNLLTQKADLNEKAQNG